MTAADAGLTQPAARRDIRRLEGAGGARLAEFGRRAVRRDEAGEHRRADAPDGCQISSTARRFDRSAHGDHNSRPACRAFAASSTAPHLVDFMLRLASVAVRLRICDEVAVIAVETTGDLRGRGR